MRCVRLAYNAGYLLVGFFFVLNRRFGERRHVSWPAAAVLFVRDVRLASRRRLVFLRDVGPERDAVVFVREDRDDVLAELRLHWTRVVLVALLLPLYDHAVFWRQFSVFWCVFIDFSLQLRSRAYYCAIFPTKRVSLLYQ